jgi:transcriptional regulator with XRE-family HTH domain
LWTGKTTSEYKCRVYKFGSQLRAWREAADYTQVELAEALEVKQQTVSDWERDAARPRPARARAIEKVLGLPPDSVVRLLFGGDPAAAPPSDAGQLDYNSRIATMPRHVRAAIDDLIEAEERRRRR